MYFANSGPRKTWLHKCLKSAVEEYPSKSNMVNGPKHVSNLNGGTFATVIDHCEGS